MVNLTTVPTYVPPAPGTPLPAAAARRAAGYPVAAAFSRPPLQRDFSSLQPGAALLERPHAQPTLPEVGRRRRSLSRRARALLQAGPAAAPGRPLAASAACAAAGGGAACFAPRGGFSGLDAPVAGTLALAVGRRHVLQAAGGVMTVYTLGATGLRSTVVRTVSLAAFFAAAAPSCEGVHDAAAAYDKAADRFVVAAACGGFGRVLLGVSATPNPGGTWFIYGLVADAVGTPLECAAPKEAALVDYPQIGYNADGLFLTYHSTCPSSPAQSGAVLLSLPKYKAYQGAPSMFYSVHTSADVAAAAGLPGGPASVVQLQPVAPQAREDVREGVAYFVADVSSLPRASMAGGDGPCRVGGRLHSFVLALDYSGLSRVGAGQEGRGPHPFGPTNWLDQPTGWTNQLAGPASNWLDQPRVNFPPLRQKPACPTTWPAPAPPSPIPAAPTARRRRIPRCLHARGPCQHRRAVGLRRGPRRRALPRDGGRGCAVGSARAHLCRGAAQAARRRR
jgi:hypothetical protein